MTPYIGQTVRVNFLGTTDPSLPTTFRIDDVSILSTSIIPAQVTLGPTSLNFGSVQVGTCSQGSFAIQHVLGTGPASGTVSASPNPPFSILSGSPFSASNGAGPLVTVQFCPTSVGTFTGSAVVSSPGTTFTNTNTVALTGTGFTPPPSTGAIQVNATLNGAPWSGIVNYTLTGPTTIIGNGPVPNDFQNRPIGIYTLNYSSGGPSGATLASITPSPTQTLSGGGVITFTLNFSQAGPQVTLGPTSLNFGDVQVGSCTTGFFAVQHVLGTGSASGTVSAGSNPPFSITSNSSFNVSNGSAVNVGVQFCPTSTNNDVAFSGSATVSSPGTTFTNTNTVSLTGRGINPIGAIQVKAKLNGVDWSGALNYTLTGPVTINGTSVPADFQQRPPSPYTLNYTSGGPSGASLASITPAATQTLNTGGLITFTLNFAADTVTITSGPSGTPNPVASGGAVSLSVSATDSLNHTLSYVWSTLCSGLPSNGSFSNASIQNPTWTAPTNTTGPAKSCTLTVTASDGGFGHSDTKSFTETVNSSTSTQSSEPVVLIHGIGGSQASFGSMKILLESLIKFTGPGPLDGVFAFKVFNFDYSSRTGIVGNNSTPIENLADDLSVCLGKLLKSVPNPTDAGGRNCFNPQPASSDYGAIHGAMKVHIVAHSMGGLVALNYISGLLAASPYKNDVGRLVTLGTPFFGGHFASSLFGKQGEEMKFASEFLWKLQQKWKTTLDSGGYKKADILNVVGTWGSPAYPDSDRIVPIASAVLPDLDIRSHRYVSKCHANFPLPFTCNNSQAIAFVDAEHPSYKLVRSFLLSGQDPMDCQDPECGTTPPTTTGDLFVRLVEQTNASQAIPSAGAAILFNPAPTVSPSFDYGSPWGTVLVRGLPAGSYTATIVGQSLSVNGTNGPTYKDGLIPITSIAPGRTTVLDQPLDRMDPGFNFTVAMSTPAVLYHQGDRFPLFVHLFNRLVTQQPNSVYDSGFDAAAQPAVVDGYIWKEIPGGGRFFLMSDFTNFTDQRTPVVSSFPFQNFAGPILSMPFPSDSPTGTYTFFAVGVLPGSDPFNAANWVTNRAELSVTLTQ